MSDWIDVEDRLPVKESGLPGTVRVLAYGRTRTISNTLRMEGIYICNFGTLSGDWLMSGNYYVEDVTHWMPLPDPPTL